MAKNYYITLEVHDEGEWPRIAPEDLMQHVDVRLPNGLTLASAKVSETAHAEDCPPYICSECGISLATDEVDMCTNCRETIIASTEDKELQPINAHDPDHLNPAKGGNRAGDDYW